MQRISVRNGLHLVFGRNSDNTREIFVGMSEDHREAYKIAEDVVKRGLFEKYYVTSPYHYECEKCQMKEYGIDIVISEDCRYVTFEHYRRFEHAPHVIYRVPDHKFINGRWVPDDK